MSEVKVTTQDEYNEIEKVLVAGAIKALGISEKAAKLRVKAIVKSGILSKFGNPDELPFQVAIDCAMQIPQLGESEEDQINMTYCIEVDRGGIGEESMTLHTEFDHAPSREEIVAFVEEQDCGYDEDYCKIEYYRVS